MNNWKVDSSESGSKLLSFARSRLKGNATTRDIRWAIEHNRCYVNGTVERFCSTVLNKGDRIEFSLEKKPLFTFEPSRILYEDRALLIYNKPAGIPSEEGIDKIIQEVIPSARLVHRLDRDTSGALLFAKNAVVQKSLENLFRTRKIKKAYLALVRGTPKKKKGVVDTFVDEIARREGETTWGVVSRHTGYFSKTEWVCEKAGRSAALLRCHPLTGKTHQIRVHLSYIGHPIIGDVQYGGRHKAHSSFRPLLHAESLEFVHPTKEKPLSVSAPLPQDFRKAVRELSISAR